MSRIKVTYILLAHFLKVTSFLLKSANNSDTATRSQDEYSLLFI